MQNVAALPTNFFAPVAGDARLPPVAVAGFGQAAAVPVVAAVPPVQSAPSTISVESIRAFPRRIGIAPAPPFIIPKHLRNDGDLRAAF